MCRDNNSIMVMMVFRHVQVRDREGKSTLLLINVLPEMRGEYRLVVVSRLCYFNIYLEIFRPGFSSWV